MAAQGETLTADQEVLLEAWRSGNHDLSEPAETTELEVLRIDDDEAGSLAPDGSLVLIAWVEGLEPARDLLCALQAGDGAGRAAPQRELRRRVDALEDRAREEPSLAAVVELRWGGTTVATLPLDRRLGFNLVRVPYHGGRLDVRHFRARVAVAEGVSAEVAVLLRPPLLSPVEGAALRMIDPRTGRVTFEEEEADVFGKIAKAFDRGAKDVGKAVDKGAKAVGKGVQEGAQDVGREAQKGAKVVGQGVDKGAKVVGQGVEKGAKVVAQGVEKGAKVAGVDAKNVAKAGQEVAKGVGRAVVRQAQVAQQEEAAGDQGVGPGAEDGAGAGAGDAAGDGDVGADVAVDAAEAAPAVAGAFARPHVFAARGDFGLDPEPDAEALLAYRNRVLGKSR